MTLLESFFEPLVAWRSEGYFSQSIFIVPPIQVLRELPCLGSFSVLPHIRHIEGLPIWGPNSAHQLPKRAPWVGSYYVVQCIRRLLGQPLYCSIGDARGRETIVMTPLPTRDSAVSPCFHGWPVFLHRHFPPQSSPSNPLDLSLHSQQKPLPWDCSKIPKPAPSLCIFQVIYIPVWGMYGCGKDCLILNPLGCHRSAVSLSALNISSLTQTIAQMWGSDPCFSSSIC